MISIVGAGHAYPETALSLESLKAVDPAFSLETTPTEALPDVRWSTLPLSYLTETGNVDVAAAQTAANESPTDLATRAAEMALSRAGISWEEVSLIVGDGSTPVQLTPSEAQRVGGNQGIKIPAYDMYSPATTFALQAMTFASWKQERVPAYILAVSTHTATQVINYRQGEERLYFGDGASAMVYAPGDKGRLVVRSAKYFSDPAAGKGMHLGVFKHLKVNMGELRPIIAEKTKEAFAVAKKDASLITDSGKVILTQLDSTLDLELADELEVSRDRLLRNVDRSACMLSANDGAIISESWDTLDTNLVCATAGPGVSFGYVALEIQGG